ncbi:guanylate kinase [bacterium]|nr:guanylate kinase [bacterium]MBU1782566.1 guanylate kinase [bacterium]MBU2599048.1 guanylate kinase [bacterium]
MAGLIIVISAPSGTGKTTICKHLLKEFTQIKHSVSYTTRLPRANEVEGESYCFVSKEEFDKMVVSGQLAEWAKVHGNYYGTSLEHLNKIKEEGCDAILSIDVQGGLSIKKKCENASLIFIIPPSLNELRNRLEKRNTEELEHLESRLRCAHEEVKHIFKYDYFLINHDLEETINNLKSIIIAERHKIAHLPESLL